RMWCPGRFPSFGSFWRGFARGTVLADRTGGNARERGAHGDRPDGRRGPDEGGGAMRPMWRGDGRMGAEMVANASLASVPAFGEAQIQPRRPIGAKVNSRLR